MCNIMGAFEQVKRLNCFISDDAGPKKFNTFQYKRFECSGAVFVFLWIVLHKLFAITSGRKRPHTYVASNIRSDFIYLVSLIDKQN